MSEQVYKHIEVTGTSSTTIEDAVNNALTRAGKTVRQMRWFEITEMRGAVEQDHVSQWQITIKLGFKLDD
jgi:dodecin